MTCYILWTTVSLALYPICGPSVLALGSTYFMATATHVIPEWEDLSMMKRPMSQASIEESRKPKILVGRLEMRSEMGA